MNKFQKVLLADLKSLGKGPTQIAATLKVLKVKGYRDDPSWRRNMAEKWTNIGSVRSETSRGTAYGLDVNEDGTLLRCHCMAYIHSKEMPKSCKHTLSSEAGTLLRGHLDKTKPRYFRVGSIQASRINPGETFRPSLYGPSYAIVKEEDFKKLQVLADRVQTCAMYGWALADKVRLKSALYALGVYI